VAESSGSLASLYIFNSVIATAAVVAATALMSAAAGYVLSKKQFRGKKLIQTLNQAALMFVSIAVAVPRFLIIKKLGLMENFLSHILPLLAMPVGLFLVQQFIDQMPDSLIEAAQIDGCSDYGILFRIVMPVIKPALATVSILAFQSAWSSVEASQMYLESEKLKTFAYYLAAFTAPTGNSVTGQAMAAAAVLILFVPNVILFVVMQSKVMNTVAYSGIK
ncbi:MAG: carbohydrate ABC transporter permease, partial [Subdoligranulum sp.]|nr:carbohydrate ABC transporter permease [Subdoligranulum sp.]